MHIGIIGAGKVGCSMGKYLEESGISLSGYYSRTRSSAAVAAEFTDSAVFETAEELVSASDTLFIATPDNSIGEVWDCIAKYNIEEKTICHFSGSLSSDVFSCIEEKGASGCSVHPMLAFNDRFSSYRLLSKAIFTVEGGERAIDVVKDILGRTGNKVIRIESGSKGRYHAAASILSNHMTAIYRMGMDNLRKCGFSMEDAKMLVAPLIKNNVDAFLEKGSAASLTGPVERNDTDTVGKHLSVLSDDDREIYRKLSLKLLTVSKEKNPGRDYKKMENLLKKGQ